ncbi:MAG: hypothetical protein QXI19_06300 [Candidatus Caldarchaeum sp.]
MDDIELAAILYRAGFRGQDLVTMVAIALAENPWKDPSLQSGFSRNGIRERSFGLFQLNLDAHPDLTLECATSPSCSAEYAYRLFRSEGFRPWTAYLTGAFWSFWDRAWHAVQQLPDEARIIEIADRASGIGGAIPEEGPGLTQRITNAVTSVFSPITQPLSRYLNPSFLATTAWRTFFVMTALVFIIVGVILYGIGLTVDEGS